MKATTFLLALLLCVLLPSAARGQCQIQVYTNYVVSNATAVTATPDIITSVVVDGSASMSMSYPCPDSIINSFNQGKQNITHYPSVQNQIGSVGGWTAAPSICAECYLSFQSNTDSGPVNAGQNYTFTYGGQVNCATAGLIFSATTIHTYSIRLSAYIFNGLSNGRCTWVPTCAGKCSSQNTTNTFNGLCYTTGPYKQCFDLLRDGVCWDYRTFCYGKAAPGICTN